MASSTSDIGGGEVGQDVSSTSTESFETVASGFETFLKESAELHRQPLPPPNGHRHPPPPLHLLLPPPPPKDSETSAVVEGTLGADSIKDPSPSEGHSLRFEDDVCSTPVGSPRSPIVKLEEDETVSNSISEVECATDVESVAPSSSEETDLCNLLLVGSDCKNSILNDPSSPGVKGNKTEMHSLPLADDCGQFRKNDIGRPSTVVNTTSHNDLAPLDRSGEMEEPKLVGASGDLCNSSEESVLNTQPVDCCISKSAPVMCPHSLVAQVSGCVGKTEEPIPPLPAEDLPVAESNLSNQHNAPSTCTLLVNTHSIEYGTNLSDSLVVNPSIPFLVNSGFASTKENPVVNQSFSDCKIENQTVSTNEGGDNLCKYADSSVSNSAPSGGNMNREAGDSEDSRISSTTKKSKELVVPETSHNSSTNMDSSEDIIGPVLAGDFGEKASGDVLTFNCNPTAETPAADSTVDNGPGIESLNRVERNSVRTSHVRGTDVSSCNNSEVLNEETEVSLLRDDEEANLLDECVVTPSTATPDSSDSPEERSAEVLNSALEVISGKTVCCYPENEEHVTAYETASVSDSSGLDAVVAAIDGGDDVVRVSSNSDPGIVDSTQNFECPPSFLNVAHIEPCTVGEGNGNSKFAPQPNVTGVEEETKDSECNSESDSNTIESKRLLFSPTMSPVVPSRETSPVDCTEVAEGSASGSNEKCVGESDTGDDLTASDVEREIARARELSVADSKKDEANTVLLARHDVQSSPTDATCSDPLCENLRDECREIDSLLLKPAKDAESQELPAKIPTSKFVKQDTVTRLMKKKKNNTTKGLLQKIARWTNNERTEIEEEEGESSGEDALIIEQPEENGVASDVEIIRVPPLEQSAKSRGGSPRRAPNAPSEIKKVHVDLTSADSGRFPQILKVPKFTASSDKSKSSPSAVPDLVRIDDAAAKKAMFVDRRPTALVNPFPENLEGFPEKCRQVNNWRCFEKSIQVDMVATERSEHVGGFILNGSSSSWRSKSGFDSAHHAESEKKRICAVGRTGKSHRHRPSQTRPLDLHRARADRLLAQQQKELLLFQQQGCDLSILHKLLVEQEYRAELVQQRFLPAITITPAPSGNSLPLPPPPRSSPSIKEAEVIDRLKRLGTIVELEEQRTQEDKEKKMLQKIVEVPVPLYVGKDISVSFSNVGGIENNHSRIDETQAPSHHHLYDGNLFEPLIDIVEGENHLSADGTFAFRTNSYIDVTPQQPSDTKCYSCDVCSAVYQHSHMLRKHYLRLHVARKYISERDMEHYNIDPEPDAETAGGDKLIFRCHTCRRCFCGKLELKSHLTDHPPVTEIPKPPPKQGKQYKCPHCENTFKWRKVYGKHKKNCKPPEKPIPALNDKPSYHCLYCNETFFNANKKKNHVLSLHPYLRRRHGCVFCKQDGYPTHSALFSHLLEVHSDVYFGCLECRKRFTCGDDLQAHNTEKHDVAAVVSITTAAEHSYYTCQTCEKVFLVESSFQEHIPICGNPPKVTPPPLPQESFGRRSKLRKNRFSKPEQVDPETLFYSRVAGNIRENLLHHLDGKLESQKVSEDLSGDDTKTRKLLNFSAGFSSPTAGSLDGKDEPSAEPGTSSRAKTPWEKYSFPKNYDGRCGLTSYIKDTSYLDISTQLIMRRNLQRLNMLPMKEPQPEEDVPSVLSLERLGAQCAESFGEVKPPTDVSGDSESATSILGELSGEWVRDRMYICSVCGWETPCLWTMEDHKYEVHPNVLCPQHELVGDDRHLSKLIYTRLVPTPPLFSSRRGSLSVGPLPPATDAKCTKCGRTGFKGVPELHLHIMECAGEDLRGVVGVYGNGTAPRHSSRRKWRSSRKRRSGRRGLKRNIPSTPQRPPNKLRTKPGDTDTIQKMIANLPAKRVTRRVIGFDEIDIRTRSQMTIQNVLPSNGIQRTVKPNKPKQVKQEQSPSSTDVRPSLALLHPGCKKEETVNTPTPQSVTDFIDTSAEHGNVLSSLRMMPVKVKKPVEEPEIIELPRSTNAVEPQTEPEVSLECAECGLSFENTVLLKRHKKTCLKGLKSENHIDSSDQSSPANETKDNTLRQMPKLEIEKDLAPVNSSEIPVLSPVAEPLPPKEELEVPMVEKSSLEVQIHPLRPLAPKLPILEIPRPPPIFPILDIPKDIFIGISFFDGKIKYETLSSVSEETEKLKMNLGIDENILLSQKDASPEKIRQKPGRKPKGSMEPKKGKKRKLDLDPADGEPKAKKARVLKKLSRKKSLVLEGEPSSKKKRKYVRKSLLRTRSPHDEKIRPSVADSGVGVKPEDLQLEDSPIVETSQVDTGKDLILPHPKETPELTTKRKPGRPVGSGKKKSLNQSSPQSNAKRAKSKQPVEGRRSSRRLSGRRSGADIVLQRLDNNNLDETCLETTTLDEVQPELISKAEDPTSNDCLVAECDGLPNKEAKTEATEHNHDEKDGLVESIGSAGSGTKRKGKVPEEVKELLKVPDAPLLLEAPRKKFCKESPIRRNNLELKAAKNLLTQNDEDLVSTVESVPDGKEHENNTVSIVPEESKRTHCSRGSPTSRRKKDMTLDVDNKIKEEKSLVEPVEQEEEAVIVQEVETTLLGTGNVMLDVSTSSTNCKINAKEDDYLPETAQKEEAHPIGNNPEVKVIAGEEECMSSTLDVKKDRYERSPAERKKKNPLMETENRLITQDGGDCQIEKDRQEVNPGDSEEKFQKIDRDDSAPVITSVGVGDEMGLEDSNPNPESVSVPGDTPDLERNQAKKKVRKPKKVSMETPFDPKRKKLKTERKCLKQTRKPLVLLETESSSSESQSNSIGDFPRKVRKLKRDTLLGAKRSGKILKKKKKKKKVFRKIMKMMDSDGDKEVIKVGAFKWEVSTLNWLSPKKKTFEESQCRVCHGLKPELPEECSAKKPGTHTVQLFSIPSVSESVEPDSSAKDDPEPPPPVVSLEAQTSSGHTDEGFPPSRSPPPSSLSADDILNLTAPMPCSEDVTLSLPSRSISPNWSQHLWDGGTQSHTDPSLGTIINSVNKLLNEPESTYTPLMLPQYSLADLQKAMGASDAEMAVLHKLGEGSLQEADEGGDCIIKEEEWADTCIIDLDNQPTPPPLPTPAAPPRQDNLNFQPPPAVLSPPHLFAASSSSSSPTYSQTILNQAGGLPSSNTVLTFKDEIAASMAMHCVRQRAYSNSSSLLAAHSGKEVVCPTCSCHFMGFPALQVHVHKAHSEPPSSSPGFKPKVRRSSITVHKQDLTTLNRRVVLESAKESRLICFMCQQILPSNLMYSHLVVEHSLKSTDITKCTSVSGETPNSDGSVGGERLINKMSSALGDLLDRAVNNLLMAKRPGSRHELTGGAVQLLNKLCAVRGKDGGKTTQNRIRSNSKDIFRKLKLESCDNSSSSSSSCGSGHTSVTSGTLVSSDAKLLSKSYNCAICGQTFPLATLRNRHVLQMHMKSSNCSDERYNNEAFEYENDWREAPSPSNSGYDSGTELLYEGDLSRKAVHPLCSDCGLSFRSINDMTNHRLEYHAKRRRLSTDSVTLVGGSRVNSPTLTSSRRSSFDTISLGQGCSHPMVVEKKPKKATGVKKLASSSGSLSPAQDRKKTPNKKGKSVATSGNSVSKEPTPEDVPPTVKRKPGRPKKIHSTKEKQQGGPIVKSGSQPAESLPKQGASGLRKNESRKKVRLAYAGEGSVKEKAEAALRELNQPKKNKDPYTARWANVMTFTRSLQVSSLSPSPLPSSDVYDFSDDLSAAYTAL